ncbi:MAG: hypothetical protein WC273_11980 [Dehalococcoidia bacterium]
MPDSESVPSEPTSLAPPQAAAPADRSRAPRKTPSGPPKWEADARARLRAAIQRFSRPLAELHQRDANEGDTRLLITDFLCDGLGFDKFADLTTEYAVRGEFADYGVRIDRDLIAFIEVKRVTTKLNARHLRQVESYAVNEGVEWMFLTNGAVWQVWHITGGLPVSIDLTIEVDLLGPATPAQKTGDLFYITREALKRHLIDDLWKARSATSPKALATVLRSAPVVDAVRRELRRASGHRVESAELLGLLSNVIRPDL